MGCEAFGARRTSNWRGLEPLLPGRPEPQIALKENASWVHVGRGGWAGSEGTKGEAAHSQAPPPREPWGQEGAAGAGVGGRR